MKFENMLNTITLGDSYKLIKDIPDNSVDLVIIDPPYLIQDNQNRRTGMFKERKNLYTDKIEEKNLINNINLLILDELCRVLKTIYIYTYGVTKHKYINI